MANSWMNHVRNFRQRNSKLSYRDVLKQARKTYGGGVEGDIRSMVTKNAGTVSASNMSGGKRKRSKTRRRRR